MQCNSVYEFKIIVIFLKCLLKMFLFPGSTYTDLTPTSAFSANTNTPTTTP